MDFFFGVFVVFFFPLCFRPFRCSFFRPFGAVFCCVFSVASGLGACAWDFVVDSSVLRLWPLFYLSVSAAFSVASGILLSAVVDFFLSFAAFAAVASVAAFSAVLVLSAFSAFLACAAFVAVLAFSAFATFSAVGVCRNFSALSTFWTFAAFSASSAV